VMWYAGLLVVHVRCCTNMGEAIKPIIVGGLVDIFVGELWRLDSVCTG